MFRHTLSTLTFLLVQGCLIPNPDHCGNRGGALACAADDPDRPYCNICVAAHNGCVAEPVADDACRQGPEVPPGTATGATTTGTGAPTTTGSTGGAASTGSTSTGTASTGTSTGTASTSTGSSGATTTGTTDMSSGSSDATSSSECGNGVLEEMEACDGEAFGGKSCTDFGTQFGGGELKCFANCTIDTSGCCRVNGELCISKDQCCSGLCLGICTKL